MTLYIVYDGWMGESPEGVLIEADSPERARADAAAYLAAKEDQAGHGRGQFWAQRHEERIESFADWADWRVDEITLPYIGEFG